MLGYQWVLIEWSWLILFGLKVSFILSVCGYLTLISFIAIHLYIFSILVHLLSSSSVPISITIWVYLVGLIVCDVADGLIIGGFGMSNKWITPQLVQDFQLGSLYILQPPLYLLSTHGSIRCHNISIYSTVFILFLILFTLTIMNLYLFIYHTIPIIPLLY